MLTLHTIFWLNFYCTLIQNIWVILISISKKRDLSGESNPEEDRKKVREGSSITSNNDAAEDEVFQ